ALFEQDLLSVVEALLIGMRDVTVVLGAAVALAWRSHAYRQLSPTLVSKATTAAQFTFMIVLLTIPDHRAPSLVLPATLSTLAAGYYVWLFFKQPIPSGVSG